MNSNSKVFLNWKKQALNKLDKSSIGQIDKHIRELCEKINTNENYFTLSSCSGRISLHRYATSKMRSIWKFVSHEKVSLNELLKELEVVEEPLFFNQESTILHICCKTQENAKYLIQKAKEAGWNQCGIIAFSTKIVVELIVDADLKLPLTNSKELLVSHQYLEELLGYANKNLEISWSAIDKLKESF